MLKFLLPAAAVLAAPAMAAPTPIEQNGMHTGTTTTNGASELVTDQNGTTLRVIPA